MSTDDLHVLLIVNLLNNVHIELNLVWKKTRVKLTDCTFSSQVKGIPNSNINLSEVDPGTKPIFGQIGKLKKKIGGGRAPRTAKGPTTRQRRCWRSMWLGLKSTNINKHA